MHLLTGPQEQLCPFATSILLTTRIGTLLYGLIRTIAVTQAMAQNRSRKKKQNNLGFIFTNAMQFVPQKMKG